jgi:ATP-binding cassette subfamily B protein
VIYMVSIYVFSQYKLGYDIKTADQDTKVTALLADTMSNSINVKLFSGQKSEADNFEKNTDKFSELAKIAWDFGNHANAFQGLAMIVLELVVTLFLVSSARAGNLTIGDFVLVQFYMGQIFGQLWGFGNNIKKIYQAFADANEMTLMLMEPHGIVDSSDAKILNVFSGKIQFQKIQFSYSKDNPILEEFNLEIKSGERVAFVGRSGAGKSTIIKLLLRFENVVSGKILIDGQVIQEVTQNSLRDAIAFVPQEPILFHRTLMENIRYGKSDATKDEVIAAAKAAHAHEFITKFPEGYDTYVGERGVKLSGGERQRVAIARAILKNAPILILDEATSSLDSESESYIRDALHNLMKGRTTIAIAHRLSTIRDADRIIVMEDGKIIEEGKHEELMKAESGMYQRLWDIQVGGYEMIGK